MENKGTDNIYYLKTLKIDEAIVHMFLHLSILSSFFSICPQNLPHMFMYLFNLVQIQSKSTLNSKDSPISLSIQETKQVII